MLTLAVPSKAATEELILTTSWWVPSGRAAQSRFSNAGPVQYPGVFSELT